jgi:hypothetical protein
MTLCAKPNQLSPNPKQQQLVFQTKKPALADDGSVWSLSFPDPLSLFWLTIETDQVITNPQSMKSPAVINSSRV